MNRPIRAALLAALGLCAGGLLAGCGGGHRAPDPGRPADLFPDNPRAPLHATAVPMPSLSGDGVTVQAVSYTTFDGTRVPALLALPQRVRPRGCLIYQGGIGMTKEDSKPLWPGAAALGLATFTIDPRDTGARGSVAELARAVRSAAAIRAAYVDTVRDLRRGLDYLESRPECQHNIGYLGTSFGGALGAMLSGSDRRVKAAALTSIGATFAQALTVPDSPLLPGVDGQPSAFAAALKVLDPINPATWVALISPRPVMLINGTQDPYVTSVSANAIAQAAGQPKVVVSFTGGHNPFYGAPAASNADQVAAFFTKYLLGGSPG
jgi:fermentation-respiration switch protein FrsA (DUF1100 family)